MTDTESAWLAGIIDGEGTIQIVECQPSKRTGSVSCTYEASVAVVNTDKRMVDRCKGLAGGCVFGPVGRGKPGVWKPAYRWITKRRGATAVICQVFQYLVCKREQAEILLFLTSLMRRGAIKGNRGVVKMAPEKLAERLDLRLAMQALNHRGGSAIPEDRAAALARVRGRSSTEQWHLVMQQLLGHVGVVGR